MPPSALQLARDCVMLRKTGPETRLAGVWGGPGVVPCPEASFRHWISVDCRFLPQGLGPTQGVLSVYTNDEDCVTGFVGHDPEATLITDGGTPLFAHKAKSLPPPEAVENVDEAEYIPIWQNQCPLYTEEATAVLGGWHFPWPDGDWDDLRDQPLLVWTIEDSEPWVEAWGTPEGFRVIQRIT